MALKINLYRNNNKTSINYGMVYGRAVNSKPIDIDGLARHMAEHNTPFSKGVIKGILTDMASCIKELLLLGQPVKIADLAIFKASVVSTPAATAKEFDLNKNITTVKLLAEATGVVRRSELTRDSALEYTKLAEAVRAGQAELPVGKDDDNGGSTDPETRP